MAAARRRRDLGATTQRRNGEIGMEMEMEKKSISGRAVIGDELMSFLFGVSKYPHLEQIKCIFHFVAD